MRWRSRQRLCAWRLAWRWRLRRASGSPGSSSSPFERRGLGGAAVHGAASAAAAFLLCGFLGPAVDGDPPRGIDLHRRAEIHHVRGHRRRVKQRGEVHAAERPLAQAGHTLTLAGLAAVAIAEDLRFGLVQELDGLVARRVERRAVDDIRQELLQHVIINLRGALLDPLVLRVLPDGGRHGVRERIKAEIPRRGFSEGFGGGKPSGLPGRRRDARGFSPRSSASKPPSAGTERFGCVSPWSRALGSAAPLARPRPHLRT